MAFQTLLIHIGLLAHQPTLTSNKSSDKEKLPPCWSWMKGITTIPSAPIVALKPSLNPILDTSSKTARTRQWPLPIHFLYSRRPLDCPRQWQASVLGSGRPVSYPPLCPVLQDARLTFLHWHQGGQSGQGCQSGRPALHPASLQSVITSVKLQTSICVLESWTLGISLSLSLGLYFWWWLFLALWPTVSEPASLYLSSLVQSGIPHTELSRTNTHFTFVH